MKKMGVLVAVGVLVMWAVIGLAAADPGNSFQVTIDNFSFTPQNLTVKVGATVTWTNKDDVPHTVVNTAKKFSSRVLDTDDKFSYTFSEPGTYEYFCSVHPHMTGKVTVQ